jgi:GntR family transcriptional regulator/MocR family aminotransferase
MLRMTTDGPLYRRVMHAVKTAIAAGELRVGERLPSTREAARDLGVSRNVVVLAYDQLAAEGYLATRAGSGAYVASDLPQSRQSPCDVVSESVDAPLSRFGARAGARQRLGNGAAAGPRIDFRYGATSLDGLALAQWGRLLRRNLHKPIHNYGDAAGYAPLRQALSKHLLQHRGVAARSEEIIIVNGSQQALDLIARCMLDPGDAIIVENPHYDGARQIFEGVEARLIPCPVDGMGLDLSQAPGKARAARLVYVTPSHQFPTGAVMPVARRLQLIEWCAANNAFIIEDDYDSDFRFDARPVEAMRALDRAGCVIYVGTFAKSLFPSLRLGFVVAPPKLVNALANAKWLADQGSATLEQAVLADFLNEGLYARHIRRMSRVYARRRAALVRALKRVLGDEVDIEGCQAGVHIVAWLDRLKLEQVGPLIAKLRRLDVGVYPIDTYYLGEAPPRAGLLMGYASVAEAEMDEGVKRLADVYFECVDGVRAAPRGSP